MGHHMMINKTTFLGVLFFTHSAAFAQTAPTTSAPAARTTPAAVTQIFTSRLDCYEHVGDLARGVESKKIPESAMKNQQNRALMMFNLCAHDKFSEATKVHDLMLTDSSVEKHHKATRK
jgi:hypothetical protein